MAHFRLEIEAQSFSKPRDHVAFIVHVFNQLGVGAVLLGESKAQDGLDVDIFDDNQTHHHLFFQYPLNKDEYNISVSDYSFDYKSEVIDWLELHLNIYFLNLECLAIAAKGQLKINDNIIQF